MKRYVSEFINDQIATAKRWYVNQSDLQPIYEKVKKLESLNKQGMISDTETIIEVLKAFNRI